MPLGAVVVRKVAHHPHAGMIHLNDRRYTFGGSQPQDRRTCWCGNGIAVQCDHVKAMPRQGEAPDFSRASVDDMKQDALTCLHADWVAVTQYSAIDREQAVTDLETVRHAIGQGGAHGMRRDKGRSFFGCAIHIHRYGLPMPVQLFGRIGVVMDIDNDLLAFLEAQKGPGNCPL